MKKWINYLLYASIIIIISAVFAVPAIRQIAGLAVAQSSTKWNNVKDAAVGDNQTNGIMAIALYGFDGTNLDRIRGDTGNGIDVDVTRITETTSGSTSYNIKRANITTSSVNLAFGFTSEKVSIETDASNTDEICIDWEGGTAVCPAANTAGDSRLQAGRTVLLDKHAVTSLSVIAASGTQIIYVSAWE